MCHGQIRVVSMHPHILEHLAMHVMETLNSYSLAILKIVSFPPKED